MRENGGGIKPTVAAATAERMFARVASNELFGDKVAGFWLRLTGNPEDALNLVEYRDFMRNVSQCMLYAPTTEEATKEQIVNAATGDEKVRAIPRLVASVVVGLRMKLGLDAMDRSVPGNVQLVRRTATRLLSGYNVRSVDAAAHLHLIERAFFEDQTHYRVSTARARVCRRSRFVRWLLGSEEVKFDF